MQNRKCKCKNNTKLICGNKMPTRCNKWYLLQILLLAQHVSGTIMHIIRSSRVLYRWTLSVVFGAVKTEKVICSLGNKICNKYHLLDLVGILFPHINEDARSESLQRNKYIVYLLWAGKGGRCVGLTTVSCSCTDRLEIERTVCPGIALPLTFVRYIAWLPTPEPHPSLRVCSCWRNLIKFRGKGHPTTCL